MPVICSVEGCELPGKLRRGWCRTHYIRWWRYGDPLRERPELDDRYWAKVDTSGGPSACWPWTGAHGSRGYGSFWDGADTIDGARHIVRSTRWGYERFVGPIPEGHSVLHRCDNPPCQNPAHWFTGTVADNAADMVAKGRQARGVTHAKAKLSEDQVRQIRERYALGGISQRALGDLYGVDHSIVSEIVNRKIWRHVE